MSHLILLRGPKGSGKTAVARQIICQRSDFCEIDVDDIKREIHGDARKCDPGLVFPEAGRRVKEYLEQGMHVVADERFNDREHVQLFLEGAGLSLKSDDVTMVWLDCDDATAVRRTGDPEAVRIQSMQKPARFRGENELVIYTTNKAPLEVAQKILWKAGFSNQMPIVWRWKRIISQTLRISRESEPG